MITDDLLGLNKPSVIPPHDQHMAATLTAPIMAAPQPVDLGSLMAQPKTPDLPVTMSGQVKGPTPLDREESHLGSRLMADYGKDENPYGSANNHPGFFGKFLHGLNVATGGVNRRGWEEQGLENRLQNLSKLESEENLQGQQALNQGAEANEHDVTANLAPGKAASEEGLQGAEAENDKSQAQDRDQTAAMGPPLASAYAHRVNQVLQAGGDPSSDPVVQHLADAITSIQKQAAEKESSPQQQTFDYLLKKGMSPEKALEETKERPPVVRVETPGEERSAKNDLLKAYQPTLDSAERMNVMTDAYEKAVKNHDQQAMLNLLANHLGMTMGLQKGARITRDLYQEAAQSTPWLKKIGAKFDSDGYLSGVTLNPQQMRQMVNLAQERYGEDTKKSRATAQYLGAKDDGPERTPGKSTINYYLGLAGGDPARAKDLAAQDGWTVK